MIRVRAAPLAALVLASIALQSCIAAVIPLAAGGLIIRKGTEGQSPGLRAEPQVAQANVPRPITVADADAALASDRAAAFQAPRSPSASSAGRSFVPPGEAPLMAGDAALPGGIIYGAFVDYASGAAEDMRSAARGSERPTSVILRDPASLNGDRAPCGGFTPTVLIDLDPSGAMFAPASTTQAETGLASGLAHVRAQGVSIAWISANSAAFAGDIRLALSRSGLDPDGADALLLMRYPGDRKQTRRQDLSASSCLIALAGDERKDFDELFEYLVNPEAALGLELMIGDGWFLIPPALVIRANDAAMTERREQ